MAGTNNFLVFNEANNPNFTMSDADYLADLYRLNGLISMIADPIAHNKMYRQWSIMISAIAGLIASMNYNASDSDLTTLQANLKSAIEDVAEAKVDPRITTLENWKSSITATPAEINVLHGITASTAELNILDGLTASTSELNILDGLTASTSELNILDGAEISTTELNYLSGAKSNIQTQLDDKSDVGHTHLTADITDIQQQINYMSVSAFIPLRQDNTTYAIGDVVKVIGLSIFEYLECIASGITGDGASLTGSLTVGNAYVDGTAIWLVCDMRDGLQPGDMKYRFVNTDLAGYVKNNTQLIYFNKNSPIENTQNWRLLRLIRQMLNPLLYQYGRESLFKLHILAPYTVPYVFDTPVLTYGSAVVLLNQWCNLTPTNLTTIEDITLQDYIDISTYNTNNSVSYTESQYKTTAQTLLNDILAGSGKIQIKVSDLEDRFIKLQNDINWISRFEDEGLPNITGGLGNLLSGSNANTNPSRGALFWTGRGTVNRYQTASNTTDNNWYDPAFDASRSNAIYGNSSHVTPKGLHLCPFIKY